MHENAQLKSNSFFRILFCTFIRCFSLHTLLIIQFLKIKQILMKVLKIIAGAIAVLFLIVFMVGVFVPKIDYTNEVEINKPLKESWAVFNDENKVNDWVMGIKSTELIKGEKGKTGAITKMNMEQDGRAFELMEEILEMKKEEKYAAKYYNEMMLQTAEVNFKSKGENATVISVNSEVAGKGMLNKLVFAFMGGAVKKTSDEMYDRLKTLIENNTTDYFSMSPAADTTEAMNEPVPEDRIENNNNVSENTVEASTASAAATENTSASNEGGNAFSKMSLEEMKMVAEINFVRTRPKEYVKHIEAFKKEKIAQNRMDWAATCDELIKELNNMPPVSKLEPSNCVYEAAKKHGIEQKATNSIDHEGKNGSLPWDRVRQTCPDMATGGENLVSGSRDIRNSVILLLVDHGISSRGHRKTMLDKDWKYVACYNLGEFGPYPKYWIQNFGR